MGGGDCGYRFERAKQYLIYASKSVNENRLYTGICNRTRLLSEASEDLKFFYNLPPEGSGSTITVSVRRYLVPVHDESRFEITALPSVKVTVDGGGNHFEGDTDQDGQYQFRGLRPGTYKVKAELPSNPRNHSEAEVSVIDRGCAYREFVSRPAVIISGKVFDASGNPVPGAKVDLIKADDALVESPKGKWRFTNNEGRYTLDDIPPGRYLLGVNLINATSLQCPLPRTYFPGAVEPSSATIITVEEARDLHNTDIKLGPAFPEQEIEGTVIWPNGKPAVRAVVALANGSEPHYLVGQQKGVDSKGHFVLRGVAGCTYQVIAFTYGGRISATSDVVEEQRHAEPVLMTLGREKPESLKLVLTSPGFQHRKDEAAPPR
ncbi:MAG: carboxypeptidase-like regulatory domain-containing protein [Pyrinomonadaceae bacterium]